jgi:hypothetical protein
VLAERAGRAEVDQAGVAQADFSRIGVLRAKALLHRVATTEMMTIVTTTDPETTRHEMGIRQARAADHRSEDPVTDRDANSRSRCVTQRCSCSSHEL